MNKIVVGRYTMQVTDKKLKEVQDLLGINEDVLQYVPKYDEAYQTFNNDGHMIRKLWRDTNVDKSNLADGVVFKTEKIAMKYLDNRAEEVNHKFIQIENFVRNNDDGWVVDWDDSNQEKYYLCYGYHSNTWLKRYSLDTDYSGMYMSRDMADRILKMLNKEIG